MRVMEARQRRRRKRDLLRLLLEACKMSSKSFRYLRIRWKTRPIFQLVFF